MARLERLTVVQHYPEEQHISIPGWGQGGWIKEVAANKCDSALQGLEVRLLPPDLPSIV